MIPPMNEVASHIMKDMMKRYLVGEDAVMRKARQMIIRKNGKQGQFLVESHVFLARMGGQGGARTEASQFFLLASHRWKLHTGKDSEQAVYLSLFPSELSGADCSADCRCLRCASKRLVSCRNPKLDSWTRPVGSG